MSQMNMVQAINDALRLEMRRDSRVVVLGEDVGKVGGVFRVTQGLFDEFGDDRVIDTPLSEGGIIGTAIGMALYGLVPVPEIQFADFIFPAYDQIVSELAKYRYRSGGEYPAKLVIRTPVGGGIRGGHYHSQSPEALFIHVAGLKVVCPSQPRRRQGPAARVHPRSRPGPVLRAQAHLPRRQGRRARGRLHGPHRQGRAWCAPGKQVTIVTWGAMLYESLEAANQAAAQGVDVEVIDLRTLWPLDIDTIIASVKKTGRVRGRPRGAQELRLRRRDRRAGQREGVPPPRGAPGPRHRLRHARSPTPSRTSTCPLAHRILPAVARDREVLRDEDLRVQAPRHRRGRHRGRDRQVADRRGRRRRPRTSPSSR